MSWGTLYEHIYYGNQGSSSSTKVKYIHDNFFAHKPFYFEFLACQIHLVKPTLHRISRIEFLSPSTFKCAIKQIPHVRASYIRLAPL